MLQLNKTLKLIYTCHVLVNMVPTKQKSVIAIIQYELSLKNFNYKYMKENYKINYYCTCSLLFIIKYKCLLLNISSNIGIAYDN